MIYHVTVQGRTFEVELGPAGVRIDGTRVEADLAHVGASAVSSLLLDGASHRIAARRVGPCRWDLHVGAGRYTVEAVDERLLAIRKLTGAGAGPPGPRSVRAPMPGLVVKVEVGEGDAVVAGQGVVVVEAMKMENELRAEGDAVVLRVHVSEGDTVERDQLLVELRGLEGATPAEEAR